MKTTFILILAILQVFFYHFCSAQNSLNRKNIFSRHIVHNTEVDTLNALTLGNGRFAMTMDVTGLQTFPDAYAKGIPLGTQSEWGWHSFPPDTTYLIEETLADIDFHGRKVPYARQWPAGTNQANAANYIRQNPHRIHLATVGWQILQQDGSEISINDVHSIQQHLDMYHGVLISIFYIGNEKVEVTNVVDQQLDALAVQVKSKLLSKGRLKLKVKYPYPTNEFLDEASNFDPDEHKRLKIQIIDSKSLLIQRNLDTLTYYSKIDSDVAILKELNDPDYLLISPDTLTDRWQFTVRFSKEMDISKIRYKEVIRRTKTDNDLFWKAGGIIDFSQVTDHRAKELERRMVTSLYLTKVNCQGSSFPQETGLTYNSWFGKPHMEMAWWHSVHLPLWGRQDILAKQMNWYFKAADTAAKIASRQGFAGWRWQKMTDPDGQETPSSVGSYLLWQQPHVIYFTDLLVKRSKDPKGLLNEYDELITQSADFMASFAQFDTLTRKFILGPGVIAAQERFDPQSTVNPTYELAYWGWGLNKAMEFKKIQGKPIPEKWINVVNNLSPLPVKDSLYLFASSAPDSYTNPHLLTDHPSVLAIYGMLPPGHGLNLTIMKNTFNKIKAKWNWEDTWGWDFLMLAMTASRLGYGEDAVNALLMPVTTNTYLKNGHNYQTPRLRVYLPGNGGLLTALAIMAAGTEENPKINQGFPKSWKVRSEGISLMP